MMELRHLKTFAVVAEVHGFTKAAEVLGYAQSSITTQIQALEEELESQLFDRLGKTVVLTDIGKRLLPYAQEMLRLQANMKEFIQLNDKPSGTLTIGAPESLAAYRLPEVIKEYRHNYPQVKIILKPGLCREMRNQVRNGEADFSLLLEPAAKDSDLHTEILIEEKIVLVAPLGHPLTKKEKVEAIDLQDEAFLHTEPGCSYRELFDLYLKENNVGPLITMEFWNIEAIKNCVMSGLGIALLPLITVQAELRDQKIAALHWDDREVRVSTQMVFHKAKWISPAVRAFQQMIQRHALQWNHADYSL